MKDNQSNIIEFRAKENSKIKRLSDQDIKNLFAGLIKLVKDNTKDEISNDLKEKESYFKKSIITITLQEDEIARLRDKNKTLNLKVEQLKEKLTQLRCELLLCKSDKTKASDEQIC